MNSLIKTFQGIQFRPCFTFDPFKNTWGGMSLNTTNRNVDIVRYIAEEDLYKELQSIRTFNWGYSYLSWNEDLIDHLWKSSIIHGQIITKIRGEFFDFLPIHSIEEANERLDIQRGICNTYNESEIVYSKSGSIVNDLMDIACTINKRGK